MSILQKIRLGAAIVLVCAICLPLSQCSSNGESVKPPTAKALAHAGHLFPRSDKDFQYQYGIKCLQLAFMNPKDYGLNGALTLIAFLWPLAFVVLDKKSRGRRFWWTWSVTALLLCAGTAYWIKALTLDGRWLYGAYVGEAAIAIYASTALVTIGDRLRNFVRSR
jgi:hypothetical protein